MKHHILLTNGRSGSNYLTNLLNSHPQVTNYGEVLGAWTLPWKLHQYFRMGGASTTGYLELILNNRFLFRAAQLYSAASHLARRTAINWKPLNRIQTLGIKEFYVNFARLNAFVYLHAHPEISVVHLHRENVVRRYLSYQFLLSTGVAKARRPGQSDKQPLHLNVDGVIDGLATIKSENDNLAKQLRALDSERVYHVQYEDYFASENRQVTINRNVFDFLGVAPITVRSDHRKILPDRICELVSNYDEFCDCIRGTEFEQWLD